VLAVLALGFALVAAVFIWQRAADAGPAPLDDAGGSSVPDSESPLFYRGVDAPFGNGKMTYILRFRAHSRFRWGFDVHNRGSSAVRIEGIETTPAYWRGPFRITGLQLQHRPRYAGLAGATSEPLTIPPDGFGLVIPVLETQARCNLVPGGAQTFDSVTLKYSYRGGHKTQVYPMPMVVGMVCGDPRRVVDQMLGP